MKKGGFACCNGHEIRSSTVMLQGCLSYTPIDSKSNVGKICRHKQLLHSSCDSALFDSKIIFTSSSDFLFFFFFFLLICENLKTRLKVRFLFDKLSKICSEAKQR